MYIFLLSIILYFPFQLALNPVAGVDLASIRVFILILFFAWLAQGLKKRNIRINNNLQTWMILSFLFLNAFSLLVARNSEWSIRKLVFFLSIFPIYFVASQLISTEIKKIKTIKVIVYSAIIMAIIGLIQFVLQFIIGLDKTYDIWASFVISPFLGNSLSEAVLKNPSWLVNIAGQTYLRATALFPDPHMLSFYLGLVFPFAVGLAMNSNKNKTLLVMGAALILGVDLLTFSRGGYLGLLAGIIFVGAYYRKKITEKYKKIIIISLVFLVLFLAIPSPVSQRFLASFNFKEGSNQGRIAMWKKSSEVIGNHPAVGVGLGNYPLEVNPTASYRDPIYAHNTYLDIAVETGMPNLLVWLGILGVTMSIFWKKSSRDKTSFFGMVSLVIFSAHSLVETAIYSPIVLTLFLIIISLANVETKNEKLSK